ncbi:hypothetical protein ACQJBY_039295 [Aegilops geniculata]
MGSNKRSSATVFVPCVVLGVALLVVGAHGGREGEKEIGGIAAPPTCYERCRHEPKEDIDACVKRCRSGIEGEEARGEGLGFLEVPVEGREKEVEARGGGVGAGLLAMPTEQAGREDEEKKKQADAVPVQLGYDPEFCSFMCRHIHDNGDCLQKCEAAPNEARG